MNLVEFEQNSKEWDAWRLGGIGASESAAILGLSPYITKYQLWQSKTGRAKPFEMNYGMTRGQELESKIRSRFELEMLQDFKPMVGEHPTYPLIRASFDGVSNDGKELLEIKTASKETLESVDRQIIPAHYNVQVQQQLLVSGAELCHFFVYNEKMNSFARTTAIPDLDLHANLVIEIQEFWHNYVFKDLPPPLTDKDVLLIEDNIEMDFLCNQLLAGLEMMTKEEVDQYKAMLIELSGHNKFKCGRVQISEVLRNGKFSFHKLTISEAK